MVEALQPDMDDAYSISSTSPLAGTGVRVIKDDETFALFDQFGDLRAHSQGEQGLYHEGTRYLSRWELRINGLRPQLLSSTVLSNNALLAVDLTNPDLGKEDTFVRVPHGLVHLFRAQFLWRGCCHERWRLTNFGRVAVDLQLEVRFAADFVDIFEVRGTKRTRRGILHEPTVEGDHAVLRYDGLDGVRRTTYIGCDLGQGQLANNRVTCKMHIAPHASEILTLRVTCAPGKTVPCVISYEVATAESAAAREDIKQKTGHIHTSNDQFNSWVSRSSADLRMMVTGTPHGPYPYAGVPWFSTPFGRDALITSLQTLPLAPELSAGVLRFLAATQAQIVDPPSDAEPGKIVHETRGGEMAALGEVPFGRYYGSVDATPLFVLLAGEYYTVTADRALIQDIWPNVMLALTWMDTYGDADGDGFVEYHRHTERGLANQGWKDSQDAVFHADGTLAQGPIALCEVQGYVYAAKKAAARLARMLGHAADAERFEKDATRLQQRFEEVFWCADLGCYALALDGEKEPCRVRTSNVGHCLYTGIVSEMDHAGHLAEMLLSEDFFSGWGMRTVAKGEALYNPMSYHNGSVWPHDNAIAAAGLARYGFKAQAAQLFSTMFDASLFVELQRLPELFCGLPRRPDEGPTLYPVACAPQAWSSGAVFMFLASLLGMSVDATQARVRFATPRLPTFLREVRISNLRVGDAKVGLNLRRYEDDVSITVEHRHGAVDVVVTK